MDNRIAAYRNQRHLFERFMNAVVDCFRLEPSFQLSDRSIVHSIRSRLKDEGHLLRKLSRKECGDGPTTEENLFERVTDLAGVRVLHLFQDEFAVIDAFVRRQVDSGDWRFFERPKAYSWDPEAKDFFSAFDLDVKLKETFYTSVHYVVQPNSNTPAKCEVQVRTLFEEVWGEIDHAINYPEQSVSPDCREQIRVLSKLVSAGSRLTDSIYRSHKRSRSE